MKKIRVRLAAETGMAVPVVLLAILAGFGLATAGIVSSIAAQSGTVRDQSSKGAVAVAEAGVEHALLAYNRAGILAAGACPTGTTSQNGWCTLQGSLTGVPNASFTYYAATAGDELTVFSHGKVGDAERTVEVSARSAGGFPFGDASIIGRDWLNMGSGATVSGNVASNGDISRDANATLACEYAQVGPGRAVLPDVPSGCTVAEKELSLPPVNQGDVVTNNSNARLPLPETQPSDSYTTSGQKRPDFDRTLLSNGLPRRVLTVASNTSLTLAGDNYSLCQLTLESNAKLYVAAGASVSLYFDSPENCELPDGTTQLNMASNARISPTTSDPTSIRLLFLGSDTLATKINLASNTSLDRACEQDFVIYAPRTDILLNQNTVYCGALAGKSVQVDSNAHIKTNNKAQAFQPPTEAVAPHYISEDFRECSGAPATPPASGC